MVPLRSSRWSIHVLPLIDLPIHPPTDPSTHPPSIHQRQKQDIPPALGKSSSGSPSWRLSIEDPFESFVSPRPHDLGGFLWVSYLALFACV